MKTNRFAFRFAILIFLLSIVGLSYWAMQNEFSGILVGFTFAFASYGWIVTFKPKEQFLFWLSILACVIPLFAIPNLSDDVYRFMWDGAMTMDGVSPFRYKPSDFVNLQGVDEWFRTLLPKLNSPNYYSIYPITDQAIYFVSALAVKAGLPFHIAMKLIYIVIHLLGFKASLTFFKKNNLSLYFYYLNPLVIIEGVGNLHAEIVMIGLLAMAVSLMSKEQWYRGCFVFVLAIHTKLTPLMILPFILILLLRRQKYLPILWTLAFTFIGFIPLFFHTDFFSFMSSIDLYFRKFEFNGSIYNLLKNIGQHLLGYNPISVIGPLLALALFSFSAYQLLKFYRYTLGSENLARLTILEVLFKWAVPILILHMILSTTVHPWYVIPLLYFGVFRMDIYLVMWSYLVTLTYINYNYGQYNENMVVVTFEYLIIGGLFFIKSKVASRKGII